MTMEQWREIETLGLTWLVSSDGRVKTPAHTNTYTRTRHGKEETVTVTYPECELTPQVTSHGYLEVGAVKKGKRIRARVHRLVGIAFVPGYGEDLTINHINGNKQENHPSNLEWVSLAQNTKHQWETGLVDLHGEDGSAAKLTSKQVVYIRRLLNEGIPIYVLAVIAGVSPAAIRKIRDGKTWKK
jgi:HNH endonuclease